MEVSVLRQHPRVVDQKVQASITHNSINLKSYPFFGINDRYSKRFTTFLYETKIEGILLNLVDNVRIAASVCHFKLQRVKTRCVPCKL